MFKVIDGKLVIPAGSREHRLLSEQTIPPAYGRSPAMQILDDLDRHLAKLPADQQNLDALVRLIEEEEGD